MERLVSSELYIQANSPPGNGEGCPWPGSMFPALSDDIYTFTLSDPADSKLLRLCTTGDENAAPMPDDNACGINEAKAEQGACKSNGTSPSAGCAADGPCDTCDTRAADPAAAGATLTASLRQQNAMRRGRRRKNRHVSQAARKHACPLCGFRFVRKEHLTRHVQGVHGDSQPFRCNLSVTRVCHSDGTPVSASEPLDAGAFLVTKPCTETFSRRDNLQQHQRSKHSFSERHQRQLQQMDQQ